MGNVTRIAGAALAALMLAGPFMPGSMALAAPNKKKRKAGAIKLSRKPHLTSESLALNGARRMIVVIVESAFTESDNPRPPRQLS